MMLALRGAQQKTQTFTASATWPVPAGVSKLEAASGYGAKGTSGSSSQSWQRNITSTYYRRDGGPNYVVNNGYSSGTGPIPRSDYCEAATNYSVQEDPVYYASQVCYHYVDTSTSGQPTTGAAATGFGKTFPGSMGNVTQTTTVYTNIPLTDPQYPITVPAGGSITITWME
jgi:hypothetical protein